MKIFLLFPLNFEEKSISSNTKVVGGWKSSSSCWVAGLEKQTYPRDVD